MLQRTKEKSSTRKGNNCISTAWEKNAKVSLQRRKIARHLNERLIILSAFLTNNFVCCVKEKGIHEKGGRHTTSL
jgi:hypothetical protein